MSNIEPGTYRGTSEGLTFEFRVECSNGGAHCVVSGDIARGSDHLVASFICEQPQTAADARTITGPLRFRGNPELFTGMMYLNTDGRGIGTFQVAVDLEGGFRDIFAGRLDWQGSFLRRLLIEIDGIEGTQGPGEYLTRGGGAMTVARAFEQAEFDVRVIVDPFRGRASDENRMRGYTTAEIHAAMSQRRSHAAPDSLHAHVFVCSYLAGRNNRNVLGVMYDFGSNDLNRRPREGVAVFYDHPLLSDPRVPEDVRKREYVFTLIHEIGHALNLLHSFDKSKPAALSWMNYPNLYPRGYEAGQGYDGTQEFWRRFSESFDDEEMRHLLHASPREIRAGGFPFGTYEDGAGLQFGGPEPRRTRLGANPLRMARAVNLIIKPVKEEYDLGEPVFLSIGVRNEGADDVHVPDALDPAEGYVRLRIRTPNGRWIRYRPPVTFCKQAQLVHLPPQAEQPAFEGLPLFLGSDGPLFTEPGVYQVVAELAGVDGSKNVYSQPARVRVRPPDHATESFAYKLWENTAALEALYLRHPLVAPDEWAETEDELRRARLSTDNTTESYFNYVAGLGWMTPFAPPDKRERGSRLDKAVERFARVNPEGLPTSVGERQGRLLSSGRPASSGRAVSRPGVVVTRPEEAIRAEVSPSGLFGSIGLNGERRRGGGESDQSFDPFVRLAPGRRGSRGFADIVSWNVEHLHRDTNVWKIPKVAEVVQSFRCDFWGLREVNSTALARLTETLNSGGHTPYNYEVVSGAGQQNGVLFRTDTTSVSQVEAPPGFFRQTIRVESAGGVKEVREVFLRTPLLCDVRVRQGDGKVFDFRCAVVSLNSADASYKDNGDGLRLAAARELARWIQFERRSGEEHDYLIMGDLNAETSQRGLSDFAGGADLKLLSVGLRGQYGQEALTRVASGSPLDQVVLTGEADALTPAEEKDGMLIVRHDKQVSDFTNNLSAHVPVAVRFILGEGRPAGPHYRRGR